MVIRLLIFSSLGFTVIHQAVSFRFSSLKEGLIIVLVNVLCLLIDNDRYYYKYINIIKYNKLYSIIIIC